MGRPTQSSRTGNGIDEMEAYENTRNAIGAPPVYTPFGAAEERMPLNKESIPRPKPTPMYIRIGKQIKRYKCKMTLFICAIFAIIVLSLIGFIYFKFGSETGDHIKNLFVTEKTPHQEFPSKKIETTTNHTSHQNPNDLKRDYTNQTSHEYPQSTILIYSLYDLSQHNFSGPRKLSLDAFSKQLILSIYEVSKKELHFKTYNLQKDGSNRTIVIKKSHTSHAISSPDAFEECMQYDVKSYCCQLEFSTKCFHKMANHVIVNSTIISDHLPQTYQRVSENENILVAQYEHTRSVLDMKSNRIKDIVESFDKSQKSVGIYVPAGSSQKINELINDEGYYKFCDYQLSESNDNRYDRTQNECSYIGIAHDSNFPHVKFCSNLNYIAVIVYYYDGDIIRWKLKFQYWNCPIIFEMHRVTYSLAENIVLSCDPQTIDVYTTSKWYLFRYDVKLPEIPKKLYH